MTFVKDNKERGIKFEFFRELENTLQIDEKMNDNYSGVIGADDQFIDDYMIETARVMNQYIYHRFKNTKGIGIIPVYLEWKPKKQMMRTYIRTDWLKLKMEAQLDFPKWLYKRGMHKRSKAADLFIKGQGKMSSFKAPWYNDLYHDYLEETKDLPKYDKIFKGSEGVPILHLTETSKDVTVKERLGEATRFTNNMYKKLFVKPLKSDDFVKLLDPKNEGAIWGDDNMKQYLSEDHGQGVANMKKYNSIMREVQDIMFTEIKKVDFTKEFQVHEQYRKGLNAKGAKLEEHQHGFYKNETYWNTPPSGQNKAQQLASFQPSFPNIKKLADWFIKEGILHSKPKHQFNVEAYLKLDDNKKKAKFIDSAVFLIGMSIYEKNGGIHGGEFIRYGRGKDNRTRRDSDYLEGIAKKTGYLTRNLNWRDKVNNRNVSSRHIPTRDDSAKYYKDLERRQRNANHRKSRRSRR